MAALLVRGPAPAFASGEQLSAASDAMRRFNLTAELADATQAVGACESRNHFASLWEILDTSNLVYNSAPGVVLSSTDAGCGAPAMGGWVRTGYASNTTGLAGTGNCQSWTSNSGSEYGSFVHQRTEQPVAYICQEKSPTTGWTSRTKSA